MKEDELTVIKYLSYAHVDDVLNSINHDVHRFTDLMFATKLNPGILRRLLVNGEYCGVIHREGVRGYYLTASGEKAREYLLKIKEL